MSRVPTWGYREDQKLFRTSRSSGWFTKFESRAIIAHPYAQIPKAWPHPHPPRPKRRFWNRCRHTSHSISQPKLSRLSSRSRICWKSPFPITQFSSRWPSTPRGSCSIEQGRWDWKQFWPMRRGEIQHNSRLPWRPCCLCRKRFGQIPYTTKFGST